MYVDTPTRTYCHCARQALAAAKQALVLMEDAGMPWRRPADYYAEMVKSDAHMARVKAQLMHEQTQIEAADERCGSCLHAKKLSPPEANPAHASKSHTRHAGQWKRAGLVGSGVCTACPQTSCTMALHALLL